jgi:hypothetical protein
MKTASGHGKMILMRLKKKSEKSSAKKPEFKLGKLEKGFLFAGLFCFSFGLGLISDGTKLYSYQLKVSERVDYHSTLNPYPQN